MALRKWADPEGCCCDVDANLQYSIWTRLFVGLCRLCGGEWEVGIGIHGGSGLDG